MNETATRSTTEWTEERLSRVRRLIRLLYSVVAELNEEFAEERRRFTPDGHLVGSIGEVVAAYAFDLQLLPMGTERHDAFSTDGRNVQVKLTGGWTVDLLSEPEHLIVMQIAPAGFRLIYNGPGDLVWANCGRLQKNGQKSIGVRKLLALNQQATLRIPQKRQLPGLSVADTPCEAGTF